LLVIENCHLATVDASGSEYADGHVAIDNGRIISVGPAGAPEALRTGRIIDAAGALVTPGFVNSHHHLYQWITRGYATEDTLFGWLTTLYPVWACLDAELVNSSAAANLGWLALTGCTTSTDHHYVFPSGGGDLLEAEIQAARRIGLRFHPCRGSMNLGQSSGGLPPDSVIEDHDAVLSATQLAIDRWHDGSFDSMLRLAVAPCSPFSVTGELMRESADLARRNGVRLHTHLAETVDEESFCLQTLGRTPAEYADDLGWLAPDVWLAHCVHLSDAAIARFAATGTSVAHCPTSNGRLGSGIARVPELIAAGVSVGLGVDGAASNESGMMSDELHQALLAARYRLGPQALTARQALRAATMGGAECLGRGGEIGSLEAGKLADIAVWRADDLVASGISDPVAALVLGRPQLDRLFVGGQDVVSDGVLTGADVGELTESATHASRLLRGRAERAGLTHVAERSWT